jgi:SSS family solute:Na+ symporter/sodium/pantothenate symporter
MNNIVPFGPGAWLVIVVYLLSLLVIGWMGYRARREQTLNDFYLAGSGFGLFVLVLTLYATQYSGTTLFGFTGVTYRIGFAWIMIVHCGIAIIAFYLLFAPQLYQYSREKGYLTPSDYLQDRFNSKLLSVIAAIVMIYALSNYFLAQLMAMGRAMQGLASQQPELAYNYGVIILALIMVIYGTLGGMRAVAWTDAIQGIVLMVGFGILLFLLVDKFGSLAQVSEQIITSTDSRIVEKARPPDANRIREWFSYILLIGMGGALYPQAIQRIYAARSAKILRYSLAIMVFLPLTAALVSVITGIYAIAYIPGLEDSASDQVLTRILIMVQQNSKSGYWLVVILLAAALAAMMSTADSILLSISSMLTKDIYARVYNHDVSEIVLTRLAKAFTWVLIIVGIYLAILLKEKTLLINLLDRKFDLLVQLVPAFMIGIRWQRLKSIPTCLGLIVGVTISLVLAFGNFDFVMGGKVYGIHPGLIGLLINILIAVSGSLLSSNEKTVIND